MADVEVGAGGVDAEFDAQFFAGLEFGFEVFFNDDIDGGAGEDLVDLGVFHGEIIELKVKS